ncbi:ATP synthase F1 subunit gamma [Natronospora cellulosivora (SeqCode)]
METMRDIKRRINSIKNTQKITKAMKMVAAAKLRRSQEKAEAARPFFAKTREILEGVGKYTNEPVEHPLLLDREGNKHLYIIINADRGLCGSYNAKVIDKAKKSFRQDEEISLLTIGRNARDYFKRRGYNIISEYVNIEDYPDYWFSHRIAEEVISLFTEGIIDKVSMVYTHFNSAISQVAEVVNLLPLTPPEEKENHKEQVDYLYEPSAEEVFDILLPKYVNNILYSALLESKASEFGARMTAMDAATDNAGELIDKLTLTYNRVRQAAITKEITEIVGGAEALK